MGKLMSRREMLNRAVVAGSFLPLTVLSAVKVRAAGLAPLDPNDPTAKSLGFVLDTSKVDASANPTHKATQKCATCAQFQGNASDASAGCNIFAGHSVPQAGWCKVWAQRP